MSAKFKHLPGFIVLILLVVIACNKDDVKPDEIQTPTSTCKIDSVVRINNGWTDILKYEYNADGDLIKLLVRGSYEETSSRSEVASFNSDGTISKIEEYDLLTDPVFLLKSYTYTYSNGNITTIVEQNNDADVPYTSTYTMTYSGDKLVSYSQTGNTNGDNMKITDIVYENGNAISMKFDIGGDGSIVVAIKPVFDDKFNHTKHMFPYPDNLLELSNDNNLVSVELAEAITTETMTLPVGTKIMDRSFTYNDKNEVTSLIDHPTIMDENGSDRTTTIAYICD